jgi:tRNA-dihydrouridine synthase
VSFDLPFVRDMIHRRMAVLHRRTRIWILILLLIQQLNVVVSFSNRMLVPRWTAQAVPPVTIRWMFSKLHPFGSSHPRPYNCYISSRNYHHSNDDDDDTDDTMTQRQAPSQRQQVLCLPCQPNVPVHTVMAPMVAASDYAFRCLIRQYGSTGRAISECTNTDNIQQDTNPNQHNGILTFTQMLHAKNLLHDETFFKNHYDLYEYSNNPNSQCDQPYLLTQAQRNVYDSKDDRISSRLSSDWSAATMGPVIAQLAGNDVATMVAAAQKIVGQTQGQIAGIDVNLGCPQNIARKGKYGAYLMEDSPNQVYTILQALRRSLPERVSVSAKIRLPYNPKQQTSVIQQLCDTGINFLTIHGRDYTENKTTVQHVHVQRLLDAVTTAQEYNRGVPVIINGGIEHVHDAVRMQSITGAAAIMSSEAILERPALLGEINRALIVPPTTPLYPQSTSITSTSTVLSPKERFLEQIQTAEDYIQWCYCVPPVPGVLGMRGGSFNVVRGHLFKFLYRYFYDEQNIDLRDWLANGSTMQRLDQASALIRTLRERYEHISELEWETSLPSSNYPDSSWYRRHRKPSSATVFIHQKRRHEKNRDLLEEYQQSQTSGLSAFTMNDTTATADHNCVSIEERKSRIRVQIEKLKNQKRITNFI